MHTLVLDFNILYRVFYKKFEWKYFAQLSNGMKIGNERPASTKKFPDADSNYRGHI